MCGIVGIINKNGRGLYEFHKDIIKEMLLADTVRGWDSTGVFGVSLSNEIHIVKQAVDPGILFRTKAFQDWNKKIPSFRLAIGHNRKATTGAITSNNAHPFKEDHITLVHNGSVFDHKALNSDAEVDSHALCHSFAKKGAIETIKSVRGAFALVWYNWKEQALYMWRNKERPLEICEKTGDIYIASEKGMLEWILKREGRDIDHAEYRPVVADTLYKITFDPFTLTKETLYEKPVFAAPNYVYNCVTKPFTAPDIELDEGQEADLASLEANLGMYPSKETEEEDKDENSYIATKDVIRQYPFDSQVIFQFDKAVSHMEGPKRWKIQGHIYLPGKPTYAALVYPPNELTLPEIKTFKDAKKLEGKIKIIWNKNRDTVIHVRDLIVPETVTLFHNKKIPTLEWEHVCRSVKCHVCNKSLNLSDPAATSIKEKGKDLGVYQATCSKCVTNAVGEEKLNALIKNRNTPIQDSEPVSNETGG